MFFRTEAKRSSNKNLFTLEYTLKAEDGTETKHRLPVKGLSAVRKTASFLSSVYNQDITVYGEDADGEFVMGVETQGKSSDVADSELIRSLYEKSVNQSLELKDKLLLDMDPDMIKSFGNFAASVGYFAKQHQEASKGNAKPVISYTALYQTLFQTTEPAVYLSLMWSSLDLALFSANAPKTDDQFEIVSDIKVAGNPKTKVFSEAKLAQQSYSLDGRRSVVSGNPVLKVTPKDSPTTPFLIILEMSPEARGWGDVYPVAFGLICPQSYLEKALQMIVDRLNKEALFKNRLVQVGRESFSVYTTPPKHLTWTDIVPNPALKSELELLVKSIEQRDELAEKGLTIKRGLLISGPPGVGKSAAISATISEMVGKCTVFLVESVKDIRELYNMALRVAPSAIIFEDLDLITVQRDYYQSVNDSATGELLQILSGATEYTDVITIATTNHPEKIDEALSKRAGRFDIHLKVKPPTAEEKEEILDLYLDKLGVEDFVRGGVRKIFKEELINTPIVGAHIEEFVKVGVKRQMLKDGTPNYRDFEPGVEAIKSITKTN